MSSRVGDAGDPERPPLRVSQSLGKLASAIVAMSRVTCSSTACTLLTPLGFARQSNGNADERSSRSGVAPNANTSTRVSLWCKRWTGPSFQSTLKEGDHRQLQASLIPRSPLGDPQRLEVAVETRPSVGPCLLGPTTSLQRPFRQSRHCQGDGRVRDPALARAHGRRWNPHAH